LPGGKQRGQGSGSFSDKAVVTSDGTGADIGCGFPGGLRIPDRMLIYMEQIACGKRLSYRGGPRLRIERPGADERFCETKPIRGQGVGYGELCETNPIPTGRGAGNRAKRTQFRPAAGASWRKLCETKPNLGRLGHAGKGSGRVGAAPPRSEMCKTNPIRELGARDCGLKDAGLDGIRVEQSQFRGSNRAKQSQFGVSGTGCHADCAKRTQLSGAGPGIADFGLRNADRRA
jgi:hypothetical protein